MQQLPPGRGNALARFLAIPLGIIAFVGAFLVGAVAWAVLLGVAIVGGGVLAINLWWKTRHLRRELRAEMERQAREQQAEAGEIHVIEGEFTIERDEDPRSPL